RRDCGPTLGGVPDIVVRPESTVEVVEIVRLANEVRKPLFLWGRATTFVDHGVREGCIVVALDLMNRILDIDLPNQVVIAETGAIWHAVDSELNRLGWELAVPGGGGMFSCTVGGTVAFNAVPHGVTEYGMTGEHVLALEVVLPDGTVVHTGSTANTDAPLPIERGANGPDLTGLFVGSCGTLGVITQVTLRIRRIPECERFLFYAFDTVDQAVDAASAIQSQRAATFLIGLFGGPLPAGIEGRAFLHAIIRDSDAEAERRAQAVQVCCETFHGRSQSSDSTRRYWTEHMYSWLRNTPASAYYGSRPYYCPEVAGFLPTQALKEAIPLLHKYVAENEDFARVGMRVKGMDVYFSPNAAFLWVDTLYPEMDSEAHRVGLRVRAEIAEMLFGRWMSPGGIVAGMAPYIMLRLGTTYELLKTLKAALDPNCILNPGVLGLGGDGD
ncbi:MAG: FAD-binding oxidoreductase, partial [Chloroflexota bacterium]|nr:FAD-binding oxidoreductase [Chloroflexota bacterium]